jgi:hypothetical protein
MNAVAVRTAGRYVGAWGAIVLCVVLLSLLFTFLGTITCAVLVGMMMGAFKGAKWFSVCVSLVFPAVILGLARGAKVELTPQQVSLLAVLCFGTFWVTYLVSAFVFFHEQKDRKLVRCPAHAPQERAWPNSSQVVSTSRPGAAGVREPGEPAEESCLEQLQGAWVCEASGGRPPPGRRIIWIKESELELQAVDSNGRITVLARGDVTLQSLKPS